MSHPSPWQSSAVRGDGVVAGASCIWASEGWHFVVKRGHYGDRILRTDDDGRRFLRGLSGFPEAIVVTIQTGFPMSPRLCVSAGDLPPIDSHSRRCRRRFSRNDSGCMGQGFTWGCGGAEFFGSSTFWMGVAWFSPGPRWEVALTLGLCRPFRAWMGRGRANPGRCPGLACVAPLALPGHGRHPMLGAIAWIRCWIPMNHPLSRIDRCRRKSRSSPCLRVSASQRATFPQLIHTAGDAVGASRATIRYAWGRVSRGGAEARSFSPCLRVSASQRATFPPAGSHSRRRNPCTSGFMPGRRGCKPGCIGLKGSRVG